MPDAPSDTALTAAPSPDTTAGDHHHDAHGAMTAADTRGADVVLRSAEQFEFAEREVRRAVHVGFDTESKPVFVAGGPHTGPDIVQAVTGEQVNAETLGGAWVHNSRSGVAHFVTPDEQDALALTKGRPEILNLAVTMALGLLSALPILSQRPARALRQV